MPLILEQTLKPWCDRSFSKDLMRFEALKSSMARILERFSVTVMAFRPEFTP